jgi:hypothetical protein
MIPSTNFCFVGSLATDGATMSDECGAAMSDELLKILIPSCHWQLSCVQAPLAVALGAIWQHINAFE